MYKNVVKRKLWLGIKNLLLLFESENIYEFIRNWHCFAIHLCKCELTTSEHCKQEVTMTKEWIYCEINFKMTEYLRSYMKFRLL